MTLRSDAGPYWGNSGGRDIPRACIVCGGRAVAGRSRCSRHGPKAPARTGPNPYGYAHQREAKARLTPDAVCARDGRPGTPSNPLQLDHIIPLSMGGTNDPSNLQLLHMRENISKGGANRKRRR